MQNKSQNERKGSNRIQTKYCNLYDTVNYAALCGCKGSKDEAGQ